MTNVLLWAWNILTYSLQFYLPANIMPVTNEWGWKSAVHGIPCPAAFPGFTASELLDPVYSMHEPWKKGWGL